jgi:hypothetical protein
MCVCVFILAYPFSRLLSSGRTVEALPFCSYPSSEVWNFSSALRFSRYIVKAIETSTDKTKSKTGKGRNSLQTACSVVNSLFLL